MQATRARELAKFREKLEKQYGTQRVVVHEDVRPYEVTSTGSLTLDEALGVGGWVRGRLHEIVGPKGVAKTSLVTCSLAEQQRAYPDLAVGYIDMEQTLDQEFAQKMGLDFADDRFTWLQPDDAEDVSDMLRDLSASGLYSCVAIDSIGGMESRQAFDKRADEAVVGRSAQVITRMIKHAASLGRQHGVTVLLVNQYRANLSNPKAGDRPAGPKAMEYATTTQVRMSRAGGTAETRATVKLEGDDVEVSRKIIAKVQRSKVSVQGRSASFWFANYPTEAYGPIGIDRAREAVMLGDRYGLFERSGNWRVLSDGAKLNGEAAVAAHLRENPAMLLQVREDVLKAVAGNVRQEVITSREEEEMILG